MRINQETLSKWRAVVDQWLMNNHGLIANQVTTGRDAWTVAHRTGIALEAYDISRDITDAHIQTALQRIFPNAVFRDKKRY